MSAGLIGALIVLPQGVAFAMLAGLPPEFGLYCAIVPTIVAALWGSSWQLISGPTNAIALVVLATMSSLATPGSADYIRLVLTLTLLIGVVQLLMGLARLGTLVNFISHTVIVGFTAGAALLIIVSQLKPFFGVALPAGVAFYESVGIFFHETDTWTVIVGLISLSTALIARRFFPQFPYMIVAMLAGSLFALWLSWNGYAEVATLGGLPSGLPIFSLPSLDPETMRKVIPAALAITLLGLTEASSIGRSIASKTGQRIDSNQEFIGQGLANLSGAFFSAFPSSGSFNRSAANFAAGAQTPIAAVFAALILLVILLLIGPLVAYLPMATTAAVLFIVAAGLIDLKQIRTILRASRVESTILAITFITTLLIQIEFAILIGVLCSLFSYLNRTTHPKVHALTPDPSTQQRRFSIHAGPECPQLKIIRIDGSLFFGAIEHIRDELAACRSPEQKNLLILGDGINFIDVAGAEWLVQEAQQIRNSGGILYFAKLKPPVLDLMIAGSYQQAIGAQYFFATKEQAIAAIYQTLDPNICRACTAKIFKECWQSLPSGTQFT